jgi:hypothetical protein
MGVNTYPIAGVDLTEKIAGTGSSSDQGNQFKLGTRIFADDGQEYVYVHASGAITQYYWVGIDEDWEAAMLTDAMAQDGWMIGVAQVAFSDNDFGWVAVRGANLRGSAIYEASTADVQLFTSATAGLLQGVSDLGTGPSVSYTKINGVVNVAPPTSATTNTAGTVSAGIEVLLTFPNVDSLG